MLSAAPHRHFSEIGRKGARNRWDAEAIARGVEPGPRSVKLDNLTAAQRRLILALVDAVRGDPDPGTK